MYNILTNIMCLLKCRIMTVREFIKIKKEKDNLLSNIMDSSAWDEVYDLMEEYVAKETAIDNN